MTPGDVTFIINGSRQSVPAAATLISALRDHLGLTGAKLGCGEGACGACTVLIDGEPVKSCQRTAASAAGQRITTIEGLRSPTALHPVQEAFAQEGAAQCGYCTPGMILATAALLAANPDPDDEAIDAALAGQICRCGCYPRIRRAVHTAATLAAATEPGPAIFPDLPPDSERWALPLPGESAWRPAAPWDLTEPADRDWFGLLADGLVVVLPPPDPAAGWNTSGGAWLHVTSQGSVTAFTGKVDVGQDNSTALRMLVAEELGLPLVQIRIVMGDTDVCPFDHGTFGSRSMPDAGHALRQAAAHARGLLPVLPGERRVELVTGEPELSDPPSWRLVGQPHTPPGIVAAVTGARRFVSDLSQPGMWHGAVLRPPASGATLRVLDATAVQGRPGVLVVRAAGLTGVVAADSASAAQAVADLRAQWDLPDAPSDDHIAAYLREHLSEGRTVPSPRASGTVRWGGPLLRQEGSAATALEVAAVRCEAAYTTAYLAHAALETRTAVASWDGGRLTVWTGTQTPFNVRAEVAATLGLAEQDVRIIVPPTGGGFGGKHAGGIATEAAVLARAAGRPVRVAWSRAEEFTAGSLRPAAVIDVAAGVTQAGTLSGWTHLNINAGAAGIATPYRVADQRLEYLPSATPLPQSSYRALAATANNFARESMIDELCCAAEIDPVEFRLANLADDRLAAVLRAVAAYVGWGSDDAGGGWGIACGLEKDGRVATAAQVRTGADRRVRVTRLVTGYECGAIINPQTVRNQVEGATVMALGGAMFEEIRFTDGAITNGAFSAYRVPRLADVPQVEVILLDRPDLPPAGAGETPMIAVAPAIASAIFVVTGRRLRSLPLTSDGVLAATPR
jgi:isoquinoline 1-oxidoreductase